MFTGFLCIAHCGLVWRGLTTRQFWLEAYTPSAGGKAFAKKCRSLSCCMLSGICCMPEPEVLRVDPCAPGGRPGISVCGPAGERPVGWLSIAAVCCGNASGQLPPLRRSPWGQPAAQEYFAQLAVAQHASLHGDAAWWPRRPTSRARLELPPGAGLLDRLVFRRPDGFAL